MTEISKNDFDLLDQIDTPVFVLELDDRTNQLVYAAFNAVAREISGFTLEDVIGRTAKEVYGGHFGQVAYLHHASAMESCVKTTYVLSLPVSGCLRRIKTTLCPIPDDQGNFKWLVGTSREISTELSIQELELKTAYLNAEMEKFIHLAAHDLRTPMRNVKMIADELREDFQDMGDGKLKLIGLLENVSQKAFQMIEDLLQHAQITGANRSAEMFSLANLCHDIVMTLDPTKKHKTVVEESYINGDKNATQIVLRNLIDNALKHNETQVLVTISSDQISGSCFEITIEDDGVGIPEPVIEFINGGSIKVDSGGFGIQGIKQLIHTRGGNIFAGQSSKGGALIKFSMPGSCSSEQLAVGSSGL